MSLKKTTELRTAKKTGSKNTFSGKEIVNNAGAAKKASNKSASSKKNIDKKAEYIKKTLKIASNEFYFDKLYFLMGFKPVLRIEIVKNQTFREAIRGFENYHYTTYRNYIFISKSKSKAELARDLTKIDYSKLDNDANRKYNYFLGKLYGYPECCSLGFPEINPRDDMEKDLELYLSTEFVHKEKKFYMPHLPCSKDCKETEKIRKRIKAEIDRLGLL